MNTKKGSICFLCLEKAKDCEISVCEECVSTLISKRDMCCSKNEEIYDGSMIHLESPTVDCNFSKQRFFNGSCRRDDGFSNTRSIVNKMIKDTQAEVKFCSKCETRRNDSLKNHKVFLNQKKTAIGTMNRLMDEFYGKQSSLNNKISELSLSIDRNNEEIEEIKAAIQTTYLQLKTLSNNQESAALSCINSDFREGTMTQENRVLQSALDEVNESIEITREILRRKRQPRNLENNEAEKSKLDGDLGMNDVTFPYVPVVPVQNPEKLIPESFSYLKSFECHLDEPVGVTSTPDGLIYVSDYNHDRIQVFDSTGQVARVLTHVTTDTGRQTPFLCPTGLACDKKGNLVIAERGRHRIAVTNNHGKLKFKFGKMGKAHSKLRDPHGVTVDKWGRIIVADTSNCRIQVFDKNGDFVFAFGNTGEEQLDYPTYVVFHKGLFFVSDTDNDQVKVYDKDGDYLRHLSYHPEGVFSAPSGLAIYQDDYILVCDYNNDCVKMFSLDGKFISKFGCEGHEPGQFCGPESVAVSRDHQVIVTDKNNNRVQIFT